MSTKNDEPEKAAKPFSKNRDALFKAGAFLGSAFEHGVLEQLQGADRQAASTVKLVHTANGQGEKIFRVDFGISISMLPVVPGN